MPTVNTSLQATDWAPKLCRKCANLNAPCSKLDIIVQVNGEVELDNGCGIFTPKKTPDEENPAMATAATNTVEVPATETDQSSKEQTS